MTLQVVNTLFKDVKERGWNMKDCKVTELKEALVYTLYRSADGKNAAKY
jgi:hypothetical protein